MNLEAVQLLDRLRKAGATGHLPEYKQWLWSSVGRCLLHRRHALAPVSTYGRTKTQAELHLLEQPNVITLRLATVFGMSPRMRLDLLVNHFVYAAVTDGYLIIFEGFQA